MPDEDRVVVLDTDFLSSFLKINKLALIRDFFGVEKLYIPAAVFSEIAKTKLAEKLLNEKYIQIKNLDYDNLRSFNRQFENLGQGEKECIALCKEFLNSLLLISDKKALDVAKRNQIRVLNIPSFLLACKNERFLKRKDISKIIKDLKQKDYYEFSDEEKESLE